MKEKILGLIAGFILKIYSSTYRYRFFFEEESDKSKIMMDLFNLGLSDKSLLYAFYHQDELSCIPYFSGKNICVLVSKSKDGDIMANAIDQIGYKAIRGSSSRGAVAGLIAAIKHVRDGYKFSMAVDGPRGPIYKVKEGMSQISKKTGHDIAPFHAVPKNYWLFKKAWNQARLPKPFTQIDIVFGKTGYYSSIELEDKLNAIKNYSDFHCLKS
jgi:lysophospholipid acyltransferase (LPLAT)-like uncharacterized protein